MSSNNEQEPYLLTEEQEDIVTAVENAADANASSNLVKVEAVAGSSKSFTSTVCSNEVGGRQLYLVFSKSLQEEARTLLRSDVDVRTTHSYAYGYVITKNLRLDNHKQNMSKRKVGYLKPADIPGGGTSLNIEGLRLADKYFNSTYLTLDDMIKSENLTVVVPIVVHKAAEIVDMMFNNTLPMTHSGYLKYFHLLLYYDKIPNKPLYDLVTLDECLPGYMHIITYEKNVEKRRTIKSVVNSLKRGEEVIVKSYNRKLDKFEAKKAKNPLVSKDRETLVISTEGRNKLHCTPNHKVLTQRGYVEAANLKIGKDRLILDKPKNQKTNTDFISNIEKGETETVYDFEVEDNHNFITTKTKKATGIVVHNCQDVAGVTFEIFKLLDSYRYLLLGDSCFPGTTRVKTKSGWLKLSTVIRQFKKGEQIEVESYNETSKRFEYKPVVHTFERGVKETAKLVLDRNAVRATLDHKFLTDNRGWVEMKDLKVTDSVVVSSPKERKLPSIMRVIKMTDYTKEKVYDIEVEDNHNFIVSATSQLMNSATGIVAHNCQNIYSSFADTINAFDYLKETGQELRLTKSFRVSNKLAPTIQQFCRSYIDRNFKFEGFDYPETVEPKTHMYIARTNATLISKMAKLVKKGVKFNCPRDPLRIFELPILLMNLGKNSKVFNRSYKFLEEDISTFFNSDSLIKEYKTFRKYLTYVHKDNEEISSALKLIRNVNKKDIEEAYDASILAYKSKSKYDVTCCTVFTSKGLTVDSVTIMDCMNKATGRAIQDLENGELTDDTKVEFLCYYVASTRARYKINNAIWLNVDSNLDDELLSAYNTNEQSKFLEYLN